MKQPDEIQTKEDAIQFVSAVLSNSFAMMSPDFKEAMYFSGRFEITAKDLLEYRKTMLRHRA